MPEETFDPRELDLLFQGLTALEQDMVADAFAERFLSPPPKKDPLDKAATLKFIAVLKAKLVKMEDALIANIDEITQ